jgi:hypothetical protein
LFFAFRAPVIGITTFLKLDRPVSVGQSGLTTFACEDARFIMKITAARVIVTCPGRNFVTLKIETDQGSMASATARSTGASFRWWPISKST